MRKECSANESAGERAGDRNVEVNFDGGIVSYDMGALLLELSICRSVTSSGLPHAFSGRSTMFAVLRMIRRIRDREPHSSALW